MRKLFVIIIALLWAATAGAKTIEEMAVEIHTNTVGQIDCSGGIMFCDDKGTICTCYERPTPIERKVEWGYQVIRTAIGEKFPELVENIELGLREDGVVVWRKIK